jgi:hypothetical protein
MSAINPATQTIAALRGFGGHLPSTFCDASEQKVILKVHSCVRGKKFIEANFAYEMPSLEPIACIMGISNYNLRHVVDFLFQSHFLEDVDEQHKDYVNLALQKLNEKIEKYNGLALRPYFKWLQLEQFPLLPVATRERKPLTKQPESTPRAHSTLYKDDVSVIVAAYDSSLNEILRAIAEAKELSTQKKEEFNLQLQIIENGIRGFPQEKVANIEKNLGFVKLVLKALDLTERDARDGATHQCTPYTKPFTYNKDPAAIVQKSNGNSLYNTFALVIELHNASQNYANSLQVEPAKGDTYSVPELRNMAHEFLKGGILKDSQIKILILKVMLDHNASLLRAFEVLAKSMLDDFYFFLKQLDKPLDTSSSQKQIWQIVVNLLASCKDELLQKLDLKKNDLFKAIESQLQNALRAHTQTQDADVRKILRAIIAQFLELKKSKEATSQDKLFTSYKEIYSQLSPLSKFSEEIKPTKATGLLMDAYELLVKIEKLQRVVKEKKYNLTDYEKCFDDYLARVHKDGNWSSIPEMYSLSQLFKLELFVSLKVQDRREQDRFIVKHLPKIEQPQGVIHLVFEDNAFYNGAL